MNKVQRTSAGVEEGECEGRWDVEDDGCEVDDWIGSVFTLENVMS